MKRLLFLSLLSSLVFNTLAFNFSGTLHKVNDEWVKKVFLLKIENISMTLRSSTNMVIDSAVIDDKGHFEFKINPLLNNDAIYRVSVNKISSYNGTTLMMRGTEDNYIFVVLNKNSDLEIEADITNFNYTVKYLKGDASNKSIEHFTMLRRSMMSETGNLLKTFGYLFMSKNPNRDSLKTAQQNFMKVYLIESAKYKTFCDTTKNFFASLLSTQFFDLKTDSTFYLKLDKRYTKEKPDNYYAQHFHKEFYNWMYFLPIGTQVPEIILPDTTKDQKKLSDLKGKYVLIDFWASWCSPCRKENRETVKPLYDKFHNKGFEVFSVSQDNERSRWTKAIKSDGLVWTQVSDLKGATSQVFKDFKVQSLPTTYIISPEGKIIAKNLRGQELIDFISDLYEE